MTSSPNRHQDLVVRTCNECGRYRLTARTVGGRDLCSECMEQAPPRVRSSVARGLPYSPTPRGEVDAGDDEDQKETAREIVLGVLAATDRWFTTSEVRDRTGLHVTTVRRVLREEGEALSRNSGGPRPTEWAYPTQPSPPTPVEMLPERGDEWCGDDLRRARRETASTQSELAAQVGVDQTTLSKWEREESEPTAGDRQRLRDALSEGED